MLLFSSVISYLFAKLLFGIKTGSYVWLAVVLISNGVFLGGLMTFFANFVKTVNENRHLSIEASSSELTTGAAFMASEALAKHLIDKIGDKETAREYLSGALSLPREQVTFCE